jgi:hypothetical protein
MEKLLQDITRNEWIKYRWIEAQSSFGDNDRLFLRGPLRTPDESYEAMEYWDTTSEERLAEDE